jgi:hypothetical protein
MDPIYEYAQFNPDGVLELFAVDIWQPSDDEFANPETFTATYMARESYGVGELRRTWPPRSFSSWSREGYFTRFRNAIADPTWKRQMAAMAGQKLGTIILDEPRVPISLRTPVALLAGYTLAKLLKWDAGLTSEEVFLDEYLDRSAVPIRTGGRSPRGGSGLQVLGRPISDRNCGRKRKRKRPEEGFGQV